MKRCVVDTNVAIVANGDSKHALQCRLAAVKFLRQLIADGTVVVDVDRAIESEYRRHLAPKGQPGVGDQFYRMVINSAPNLVDRVMLPRNEQGDYVDFPGDPQLAGFDPSDRKFAALACRESIPVVNAVDSDWLHAYDALAQNGIVVDFLCGCNKKDWFA